MLSKQNECFPKPFSFQGKYVLSAPGIFFTLMEHREGELIQPGTVNENQLYHLGKVVGFMHSWLEKQTKGKRQWYPDRSEIEEKWDNQWTNAQLSQKDAYVLHALRRQKEILDQLNFQQFEECKEGWTHWDLWVDNILFYPNQVSGILDFDRMRYVYPELDLSRVLLSSTYSQSEGMNWKGISHFLLGYNEFLPFPPKILLVLYV
jgi:homoserine kinase type II